MIATPAVDLKGGRCVQLVGGRPEEERVSLPDPVAVARRWYEMGFSTLHLVDLDAALASGDNSAMLQTLLSATPATTQVGGGIRDDARVDALLEAGADRVVIGTRALEDPDWFVALVRRLPRRVMVAADTRSGYVLTQGWTQQSNLTVTDFLRRLDGLPLAGVLTTDVGQEGRLQGLNRQALARTLSRSTHPIWISGGVTTEDDLEWLDQHSAAGAVLGMALYTETLSAASVAARWGGARESGGGR